MALRKGSLLEDEAARRGGSAAAPGGTGLPAGSSASVALPPYRVVTTPAVPIATPNINQQQGQTNYLRAGVLPPPAGDGSMGKDVNLAVARGQEISGNVQSSYNVPSTTMASSTGSSSARGFTYEIPRAFGPPQYQDPSFQRPQQAHQLQRMLQHDLPQHGKPLASHSASAVDFPGMSSSSPAAAAVPVASNAAAAPGNSGLNAPPQEPEPTLGDISWSARGQKLQSLLKEVDDRFTLMPETSDLLLQMVENFVETVAAQSVRAAKHRNSEVLEVKDIQLCLEKHWGMPWIGVGPMPSTPYRTSVPPRANATLTGQPRQKPVRTKRKELK